MDIIQSIMILGVGIIAIGIITNVTGSISLAIPSLGSSAVGGATALDFQKQAWNNTMLNLTANSQSALSLTSISPLVLGAALIIGILLSVFVYRATR